MGAAEASGRGGFWRGAGFGKPEATVVAGAADIVGGVGAGRWPAATVDLGGGGRVGGAI